MAIEKTLLKDSAKPSAILGACGLEVSDVPGLDDLRFQVVAAMVPFTIQISSTSHSHNPPMRPGENRSWPFTTRL